MSIRFCTEAPKNLGNKESRITPSSAALHPRIVFRNRVAVKMVIAINVALTYW